MLGLVASYYHWLHGQWPAGTVEKLPVVQPDGTTNVSGLYVVGDLTGIPLLKFSADTGARAVQTIATDNAFQNRSLSDPETVDIAIIGGGVSGFAAAIEARKQGLSYKLFEAAEPYSTIVNFPKAKPIFTYPTDMTPAGDLQFHDKADFKEGLLEDLHEQTLEQGIEPIKARVEHVKRTGKTFELVIPKQEPVKAHRVIVGIGRSGNFRKLGVPGEKLDKVANRLHDPKDYCSQNVLVVGGGDSAMEAAIALGTCGANVTLSYRKPEFSRPKPENIEKLQALDNDPEAPVGIDNPTSERVTTAADHTLRPKGMTGSVTLMMASSVKEITEDTVTITDADGNDQTIDNDAVFPMIGREPPLDFFRRSGVNISGERNTTWWATLVLMLAIFTFFYQWKKPGTWLPIAEFFSERNWFPHFLPEWFNALGSIFNNPANPVGTFVLSSGSPGFWFSLLYCSLIVVFGIRRINRRKTPYITAQTTTLMLIQCIPLFLLPYIVFPWMGHLGLFDAGLGKTIADSLFPEVDYDPNGREYWRAFGLILAWPLFLWNIFTHQPLWGWLIISLLQTFVLIPIGIYYFGKGVYCGWICSCGAMAETLGDKHRHKMPHGPFWNRLNMIGQVFLGLALLILVLRLASWWLPGFGWAEGVYTGLLNTSEYGGYLPGLNYAWFVDLLWAGILGFGLYFHFSGRVWCRFACPLAALMHIYARFSRFAIIPEKKKCISCNVCTSVCHQGIDVMNFANKGRPMQDVECVRCSACVQSCPTGVLSFGQVDQDGRTIAQDPQWLSASPVRSAEVKLTIGAS
ncbi:NAD(P)-binding domain-containing protein [Mucisphaera calidilacus]|uniref:Electron transport protein YccM n=1 Tax=Mucisphaera calidilacus TaxID=2527982 RepID=A0A518BXL2_9BACT|nr:NAD(P)-binding domain-containing protein [Mucisphaera calidilacus]QDU71698.1 Putative electron transport protein YccM [Mucisphaera calidilacus]